MSTVRGVCSPFQRRGLACASLCCRRRRRPPLRGQRGNGARALPSQTAAIAGAGDPGHLNPAISTAEPIDAVAGSPSNGLVELDRDGELVPELAEA